MKIFFINLRKRIDRLKFIKRQLKFHKLKGSKFFGVEADLIEKKVINKYKMYLSPSGIAGCLAHKKIWKHIVNNKINYALILEDDAFLSKKIKLFIKNIYSVLKKNNIDIINLNTHEMPTKIGKLKFNIKEVGINLHDMISTEYGTAGYIISKKCAKKLIFDKNFGTLPIDLYLFSEKSQIRKKLNILQCCPGLTMPLASFDDKKLNLLLPFFKNINELKLTAMTSADYNNYINIKKIIQFSFIIKKFFQKSLKIKSFQIGKLYFFVKHFLSIYFRNKNYNIIINRFNF
jgi:glycosyl transferase family 25